jgi:hypothetical protein
MRKINLIKRWNKDVDSDKRMNMYGIDTITKSRTVGNVVDLFSSLDRLVEVGYEQYLEEKKVEFDSLERTIDDTCHLRNLFNVGDDMLQDLIDTEKTAYVRRADMKVEIQFLESNRPYVDQLSKIMVKINRFNEVKNTRTYVPRVLTSYTEVVEKENKTGEM